MAYAIIPCILIMVKSSFLEPEGKLFYKNLLSVHDIHTFREC